MGRFLLIILTFFTPLCATISKNQVLYLMQAGEVERGIQLYQDWVKENERHDFDILEQMGYILLKQGATSGDHQVRTFVLNIN